VCCVSLCDVSFPPNICTLVTVVHFLLHGLYSQSVGLYFDGEPLVLRWPCEEPNRGWEDSVKMDLKIGGCEDVN